MSLIGPAAVVFETPQGLEVRGAADRAWNRGNGFENDGAVAVAAPEERRPGPKERHAPKGNPVGKIYGPVVINS